MTNDYSYIINLAERYGTPFYLFDEKRLVERVEKIKEILGIHKLCFSIKSNPFLVPYLKNYVDKFEVCSPGEMKICIRYGVDPNQIFYSGVARKEDEIYEALSYGVKEFTAESIHQFELLAKCCKKPIDVFLRLNSGAQFGMSVSDAEILCSQTQNNTNLNILGIHYFAGTQRKNKEFNKQKQELSFLREYISKNNQSGVNFVKLEYGPGLPVALFSEDTDENDFEFIRVIKGFLDDFGTSIGITVEMGRYISTFCGKYVTKILDVKRMENANYCITDGGINHLTYAGQVMGMKKPIIDHLHNKTNDGPINEYFICGALCTTGDVLSRTMCLQSPCIDDLLVFERTGAYAVSEGISLFLSRCLPAVLIKKNDGDVQLLREHFDTSILNTGKEAI